MVDERRTGYRYADLHVGMSFRSPGRTITDADLVGFAGLTGDYSELHTSEVYAKNSQFGRRVAHGLLGLAYAHGLMWARTGELRETAVAFLGINEWKFLGPIFVGDTIFVKAKQGLADPSGSRTFPRPSARMTTSPSSRSRSSTRTFKPGSSSPWSGRPDAGRAR